MVWMPGLDEDFFPGVFSQKSVLFVDLISSDFFFSRPIKGLCF